MQILRNPAETGKVCDPVIRGLLDQRFVDVCQGEGFDPEIMGYFLLAEIGDTVAALEAGAGCPLLGSPFAATRFGDVGFVPCFEVLDEHAFCYEMVFLANDGDYGVVVIVPKDDRLDPELLRFCRLYAAPTVPQQAA